MLPDPPGRSATTRNAIQGVAREARLLVGAFRERPNAGDDDSLRPFR
jgi:hypothetical protein